MCSIYGFMGKIRPGKEQLVAKIVEELVKSSQVRGKDAMGFISWNGPNDSKTYKGKGTPTTVFKRFDRRQEILSDIENNRTMVFIGHNRKASVGSNIKENAHPFIKNDFALFHNGTTLEIFDEMNPDDIEAMQGETDSEALLTQIDRNGLEPTLKNISCYSILGLDLESGKIITARDRHRPLVIFDARETLGIRIIASKKAIGQEAMKNAGMTDEEIAQIKSYATKQKHLYVGTWENSRFYNAGEYDAPDESERNEADCEVPEGWVSPAAS